MGIAEGNIDPKIGKLKEIRINVHSDSENWAILSEVSCNELDLKIPFVFYCALDILMYLKTYLHIWKNMNFANCSIFPSYTK